MLGFKFVVVATAIAGAVVATGAVQGIDSQFNEHGPNVCLTAAPITTTITITECGSQLSPTTPAAPPPGETSWLSTAPIPSYSSPVPPGSSAPAPAPGPSGSISSALSASSGSPPGSANPTTGQTETPTPSSAAPSSSEPPTAPSYPGGPPSPSNAAPLPTAFSGMGSFIAAGIAINAAIAALV
ncbi:hypothetical protein N0V90_010240 [Kalmusia sp. IMI 367209]|nr:hypothetical protein N0V90_010240 [Kalmusia sp. IMI 367209]